MLFTDYIQPKAFSRPRDDRHKAKFPDYSHPSLILSKTQQYFFRHESLKHLRLEQIVRYFSTTGWIRRGEQTQENTIEHDDEDVLCDEYHRHYDEFAEKTNPGTKFHSRGVDCDIYQRRRQARLGVCRVPYLEPLANKREDYWQQRLLLGLPWYCQEPPKTVNGELEWTFKWDSPVPNLKPTELKIGSNHAVTFEEEAFKTEQHICTIKGIICECCRGDRCKSCLHATSFHRCIKIPDRMLWCKGTIFGGTIDYQRILFNLHRRQIPTHALKTKADKFIEEGLLTLNQAELSIQTIEAERSKQRMANDVGGDQEDVKQRGRLSEQLTPKEMDDLLKERVEMMKKCDDDGISDQFRVYEYIIGELEKGTKFLRVMVQASAGTGKSFLLTTVYLWCLCKSMRVKACAPTGIAAANIDLSGTDVSASTIHSLFDLDGEMITKLDFAKVDTPKVAVLLAIQVLMIDEFSMLDEPAWNTIASLLSIIDHSRRPNDQKATTLGNIHVILFGDVFV
jgi:hypothetical protein